MRAAAPTVVFDHLARLTDDRGLFEHARHDTPRPEHGYCVDDAARGVVVLCREPDPAPSAVALLRCYLDLVVDAVAGDGRCHNRLAHDPDAATPPGRRWLDLPGTGDWWGRAVWALGVAAESAPTATMRSAALTAFGRAASTRSPHRHAMAYAALGAAALLRSRPQETSARALLHDAVAAIGPLGTDPAWPWPEPRLRYGSAALAEALVVAGDALQEPATVERGTRMLALLLRTEIHAGHLSVTPVGGRGPGDVRPGFDQQPIEVAAIADACASAYRVTSAPEWLTGVRLAWAWFAGDNDTGVAMADPLTGAGYDGLEPGGRNANQGAESTLAMLSTAQQARRLAGRS